MSTTKLKVDFQNYIKTFILEKISLFVAFTTVMSVLLYESNQLTSIFNLEKRIRHLFPSYLGSLVVIAKGAKFKNIQAHLN